MASIKKSHRLNRLQLTRQHRNRWDLDIIISGMKLVAIDSPMLSSQGKLYYV